MKKIVLFVTPLILLPGSCLAAGSNSNEYNWGLIIGSIIVGGIFSLAISIGQDKNQNAKGNMWYKEIHMPKTAKFIKTTIAILGFYLLYTFIANLLFPEQRNEIRILLVVLATVLTIYAHKKFFNKNGQQNKT
ncbi:MAG: hypothetical protein WC545_00495 [Patescibacteria group bacterium]